MSANARARRRPPSGAWEPDEGHTLDAPIALAT